MQDTIVCREAQIHFLMAKIDFIKLPMMKKAYLDFIENIPFSIEQLQHFCISVNAYTIYNMNSLAVKLFLHDSPEVQLIDDYCRNYQSHQFQENIYMKDTNHTSVIEEVAKASYDRYTNYQNDFKDTELDSTEILGDASMTGFDNYQWLPPPPSHDGFEYFHRSDIQNDVQDDTEMVLFSNNTDFPDMFEQTFHPTMSVVVKDVPHDGDCGYHCIVQYLQELRNLSYTVNDLRNIISKCVEMNTKKSQKQIDALKQRQTNREWMDDNDLNILCKHFNMVVYIYEKRKDVKDSFYIVDTNSLSEKQGYDKTKALYLLCIGGSSKTRGMHFQYIWNPFKIDLITIEEGNTQCKIPTAIEVPTAVANIV